VPRWRERGGGAGACGVRQIELRQAVLDPPPYDAANFPEAAPLHVEPWQAPLKQLNAFGVRHSATVTAILPDVNWGDGSHQR
jgi:hypothetical protein